METRNPMVIHYVHDMDRAYPFYLETLGLSPDTRSAGWSTLLSGDLLVALHIIPEDAEGLMPHAGLCLEVDDVDAAAKEVEAAGGSIRRIRESDGAPVRVAEVSDTEGNAFELRQYVG